MKTISIASSILITSLSAFFLSSASMGQSHGLEYIKGYCAKLEKNPTDATLMDSIYTVSESLTEASEIVTLENCVCTHGTEEFCKLLQDIKRSAMDSAIEAQRRLEAAEAKQRAEAALKAEQEETARLQGLRDQLLRESDARKALTDAANNKNAEKASWITSTHIIIGCVVVGVCLVGGAWYLGIGPFAAAFDYPAVQNFNYYLAQVLEQEGYKTTVENFGKLATATKDRLTEKALDLMGAAADNHNTFR